MTKTKEKTPHNHITSHPDFKRTQVEHTLVFRNPDAPDCDWVEGRDRWWQDEIPGQSSDCAVEWVRLPALPCCSVTLMSGVKRKPAEATMRMTETTNALKVEIVWPHTA